MTIGVVGIVINGVFGDLHSWQTVCSFRMSVAVFLCFSFLDEPCHLLAFSFQYHNDSFSAVGIAEEDHTHYW